MKKQNKDWGKFESMYRGLYPDLSDEDREVLKQYPEDREFIFEQFMKTEENAGPKDMNILKQQVIGESNRVFFHAMMAITAIIIFLAFVITATK